MCVLRARACPGGRVVHATPHSKRSETGGPGRHGARGRGGVICPPTDRAREALLAYFDLDPLLEAMLDAAPNISDLNLSVGRPPQVEVDGSLLPVPHAGIERLMPYQTELIALRLLQGKRDLAEKLVRTGAAAPSPRPPHRNRSPL